MIEILSVRVVILLSVVGSALPIGVRGADGASVESGAAFRVEEASGEFVQILLEGLSGLSFLDVDPGNGNPDRLAYLAASSGLNSMAHARRIVDSAAPDAMGFVETEGDPWLYGSFTFQMGEYGVSSREGKRHWFEKTCEGEKAATAWRSMARSRLSVLYKDDGETSAAIRALVEAYRETERYSIEAGRNQWFLDQVGLLWESTVAVGDLPRDSRFGEAALQNLVGEPNWNAIQGFAVTQRVLSSDPAPDSGGVREIGVPHFSQMNPEGLSENAKRRIRDILR